MAETVESTRVVKFKDQRPTPDPIHEYSAALKNIPIVIDNGSFQCRVGWATSPEPQLIFRNVTAKQRGKKESEVQIGNEINNIEVLRWLLRSQFDRNIVTQYDVQELIFDHVFSHLGINTDGCVDHPIVLTEPVCNPNYCRQQLSELLFECYHVPQVAYGVDAMFSLYNNHPKPVKANGLIVSCGYQTTHLLPVLNGALHSQRCRRINLGGAQLELFMQKLLQLKHPGHFAGITLSRAEELVQTYTHMAKSYIEELEMWADVDYYEDEVTKVQLPYTQIPGAQTNSDQQKDRREQQIRRLKELNFKKRQEKLVADEAKVQQLLSVQELLEDGDEEAFNKALQNLGYDSVMELESDINRLTSHIQRIKQKLSGVEIPPEEPEPGPEENKEIESKQRSVSAEKKAVKEEPVYELLDVPDDQLTAEQIAVKKRQKILKSAREGRARAKALQNAKREKELQEERKLEQRRLTDFNGWLQEVRQKRQKILDIRTVRKNRKAQMSKRHTYASQQRMKMITQLAESGKRSSKKKEDTFGQDDADWDVYKKINPNGDDSDSEAEEEKLEELETLLREYDPEFQREMELNANPVGEIDVAEYYRLHVAVEKIRVPELLMQPSMMGMEQAGVAETMEYLLKQFDPVKQNSLAQYVFLTGGPSSFPGFKQRMEIELLAMRPFQSTFAVYTAKNPQLDAWLGARRWAISPALAQYSISRAEYLEKGGEYLKEHTASNRFIPTPVLSV